jgi:hypothetical protein
MKIIKWFGLFFILAFLAVRKIILDPGTVGHNWDWLIPSRIDYLQNLLTNLFYTWQNTNLGESRIFQLPSLPFMLLLLSPLSLGLGGEFISKLVIILTMVISGVGMSFLIYEILKKEESFKTGIVFASFLGGFYYAFSPYLFADFIGGAITQFFAYCLVPWLFLLVKKSEATNNFFYIIMAVGVLSFITISLQVLVLSSVLIILYTVTQKSPVRYLIILFKIYLLYFVLNSYWLFPTAVEMFSIKKTVLSSGFYDLTAIKFSVPSLWEIFIGTGYWRPLFLFSISPKVVNLWASLSFFVVFLFTSGVFLVRKSKESFYWLIIFFLSLILATGGKEPLGDQVLWLYMHFPLMALFRSPQHLIVIPTLAIGVLIGIGLIRLPFFRFRIIKAILFLLLVVWVHPFFLHGDIGLEYLLENKKDHIDVYQLSPSYEQVFDYLGKKNKESNFRIMYLPLSSSPRYLKTNYQNEGQGSDPLVTYSPYGTLVSDINYNQDNLVLAKLIEQDLIGEKNPGLFNKQLSLLNMRYVVLRKDVRPEFSDYKELWSPENLRKFLLENSNFVEIMNFEDIELYENLSFMENMEISVANQVVFVNHNPAVLSDGLDLGIYDYPSDILISHKTGDLSDLSFLPKQRIILEPESVALAGIQNKNKFNFDVPRDGQYELLIKKSDYSQNLQSNPLNPLKILLDNNSLRYFPKKEVGNWISYGNVFLKKANHLLEINVPKSLPLVENGSFEKGNWVHNENSRLVSDSFDGSMALEITSFPNRQASVWQEIKNIKPNATYKLSLVAKTINGEPPHFGVSQDTDVTVNQKKVSRSDRVMSKANYYQYYEMIFETNAQTKQAVVYLNCDPSEKDASVVVYDDIKIERLLISPLVFRSTEIIQKPEKLPVMNYVQVKPTKFLVNITNAQDPFFLFFSESFNSLWKANIIVNQGLNQQASRVTENLHSRANYFGNAWYVDKTGDYQIEIEYYPQRLFYLGGIISFGGVLFCFLVIANKLRKKYHLLS